MDFCHLHVHSEMSLLDGMSRVTELPRRARELGMSSLALTDHGVLYGAVDFYKACRAQDVRPVLGVEGYLAPRTRFDKQPRVDDSPYHLLLLVKDETGWGNLTRLVSRGFLEGFYYRPRIDKELLSQHAAGLMVTTGCPSAEVPRLIVQEDMAGAKAALAQYVAMFGRDNVYIELMNHGLEVEQKITRGLVELNRSFNLPMIATQDAHYLHREDYEAHDVLLCIQTGKTLSDPGRMRYPNDQFYLRSPEEMARAFDAFPQAVSETVAVAERCAFDFKFGKTLLPEFGSSGGETPHAQLRRLCHERLRARYPGASEEVARRLEYELSVIEKMGYESYFLIVFDFVDFAKRHGIAVGPGRGSAAGSLVAYLLGITDVDPLRYNLLFERFLNPERITMPDMDIDFDWARRGEVIAYVTEKYGADRVAQIITFGTMAARAAIRDVGRVLELPYAEVDRLAKMVPAELGITLDKALSASADLRRLYDGNDSVRRVVDLARKVEGMPRHASVHAAGVVISPSPIEERVPLQKMSDETVVTQFPMGTLEELGLLKMDFLGLRTLTVLEEARRLVAEGGGPTLEWDALPTDDENTYAMLSEADTLGVFQLESSGMREMLKELRPQGIEDIIAAVSLYRPGPMENIPLFIQQKKSGKVEYLHPDLEPVLKDTYGVMIYQEQVMQAASVMAGYSLGQADLLRRAMGKKKRSVLQAERSRFIEGCTRRGHPLKLAEQLFDTIMKFAGYGFNRAHGAAYGLLAFRTAYLKAHHPAAFLAASLSSLVNVQEKLAAYLADARAHGISVLPPSIHASQVGFSVENGQIRFGLSAVKGLGEGAAKDIVAERDNGPYISLFSLVSRVPSLNRRSVEALVKAGALDDLASRAAHLAVLDEHLKEAQRRRSRTNQQQLSLFAAAAVQVPEPSVPDLPEAPAAVVLAQEKEALGFYLSGHPLDAFAATIQERGFLTPSTLPEDAQDGAVVTVAGAVSAVKMITTRKGARMAFLTLSDHFADLEGVVFPNVLERHERIMTPEAVLAVRGKLDRTENGVKLLADGAEALSQWARLVVRLKEPAQRDALASLLRRHPGPHPVTVVRSGKTVDAGDRYRCALDDGFFLEELKTLCGEENFEILEAGAQAVPAK